MNNVYRAIVVTGFVLTVGVKPSWGGPPPNTITSDNGNTAGGTNALVSNTDGIQNTAFGFNALVGNTGGGRNTAAGAFTLSSNTTGSENTASGAAALFRNTAGSLNTASGEFALTSNITGNNNTASGYQALLNNTTGNNNIAVGARAGSNLMSGDNNIYLGNPGRATESNTLHLGNDQTTATFIAGITNKPVIGGVVFVTRNGKLGTWLSSARYKRDIHTMGERSRRLHQLRPVTFRYKQDPEGVRQYGLVAEEVASVYPELVTRGAEGEIEGVQYHELIPMLLNELQHQHQALGKQARQLAALNAQNAYLRAVVEQQHAAVAARLERLEATARTATLAGR